MEQAIVEQFSSLLNDRLSFCVNTTEDSVRYTFFASILYSGVWHPHEMILEFTHPEIQRAKVDLYIPSARFNPAEVIEIKYHRYTPSGQNSPMPQKAGQLFKDIDRLQRFNNGIEMNRTLIYVTDEEMAKYMENKSNGLYDFFHLPEGEQLRVDKDFIYGKSSTFKKSAGSNLEATIECKMSKSLDAGHSLRVYRVV